MTYTSKESSEQVELEFLSKSIGYCMKNERFGPDSDCLQNSDRHSDRRLSLPAQRQLQSLAEKLDFLLIQFGNHAVDQVIVKVQKCFIPHLKALKVILNFQCQNFPKV